MSAIVDSVRLVLRLDAFDFGRVDESVHERPHRPSRVPEVVLHFGRFHPIDHRVIRLAFPYLFFLSLAQLGRAKTKSRISVISSIA